jgi:hypothetical protein
MSALVKTGGRAGRGGEKINQDTKGARVGEDGGVYVK